MTEVTRVLVDPQTMARIHANQPVHESRLDAHETLTVQEQVEALPEQIRAVIELLFWGQERPNQIAEQLGISRRTVYRLKAAGLLLLAEQQSTPSASTEQEPA